jgi:S-adenosylmethionine-dependent methyltransferase
MTGCRICRDAEDASKYVKPKSRILDIGGGPGRYAMWLAKHGHRVVLADLSPELLAIARTKLAEADVMAQY